MAIYLMHRGLARGRSQTLQILTWLNQSFLRRTLAVIVMVLAVQGLAWLDGSSVPWVRMALLVGLLMRLIALSSTQWAPAPSRPWLETAAVTAAAAAAVVLNHMAPAPTSGLWATAYQMLASDNGQAVLTILVCSNLAVAVAARSLLKAAINWRRMLADTAYLLLGYHGAMALMSVYGMGYSLSGMMVATQDQAIVVTGWIIVGSIVASFAVAFVQLARHLFGFIKGRG